MKWFSPVFMGILLVTALATSDKAWAFVPEFFVNQENGYNLHQYDGGFDYGRGKFYLFAKCMADCDRKFWKEYYRSMRRLEEE